MGTSSTRSTVFSIIRLVTAALIAAAIVAQLSLSIQTAASLDRDVTTTFVNFLSFFTILSNAAAAVVLTVAGLWYLTRGRHSTAIEPAPLALALASVTTYMIVTGIVYNALLRAIVLPQGAAPIPWSNEVLHLIAPLILLIDLFFGPRRRALPWRAALAIVVFPIAWVVYTLIRGPLTTDPITLAPYWYPYPFLNPNGAGGWGSVLMYVVILSIVFIAVAVFVVWIGRRRGTAAER